MYEYFEQFGTVKRLRLSRSKKVKPRAGPGRVRTCPFAPCCCCCRRRGRAREPTAFGRAVPASEASSSHTQPAGWVRGASSSLRSRRRLRLSLPPCLLLRRRGKPRCSLGLGRRGAPCLSQDFQSDCRAGGRRARRCLWAGLQIGSFSDS